MRLPPLAAIALFALATASVPASARPNGAAGADAMHMRGGPALPGAALANAMAQLDLTDEQRAELEAIFAEVRDEVREQRADSRGEREIWYNIVAGGEIDREAAHELVDKAAARRLSLGHATLDRILDVYEGLTPTQKIALADIIEAQDERQAERAELQRLPGVR